MTQMRDLRREGGKFVFLAALGELFHDTLTQMRDLRREGGARYAAAMEDCCLVDLDQAMDLSELDGALLMESMEGLPPSDDLVDDGDADRLSHVIRSLEAEIIDDGKAAEAMVVDDHDGRRLEDMLSDLEFAYWPEAPLEGMSWTAGVCTWMGMKVALQCTSTRR
jgi:hypothetical protein